MSGENNEAEKKAGIEEAESKSNSNGVVSSNPCFRMCETCSSYSVGTKACGKHEAYKYRDETCEDYTFNHVFAKNC